MLTHRNILILFLILLFSLILMDQQSGIHPLWYVVAGLAFVSVEFYGAYFIHSGFHLKAICHGPRQAKNVALTFDDGPAPYTEQILAILRESNSPATFFCIGKHIGGHEEVLRKIDREGHLIGNHSYAHSFLFDLKTTNGFRKDMEQAGAEIKRVTGKLPRFFRPPYGVTTPGLAKAVESLNLTTVGWDVRSLDTSIKDPQQVLQRIKEKIRPGSVILLHDTVTNSETILRELLTFLKTHHYTIVPLDTLIQKPAYA